MSKARKNKRGRPHKYLDLLKNLKDDMIYSPGLIVRLAANKGALPGEETFNWKRLRTNARQGLVRLSAHLPRPADGLVRVPGQPIAAGWYGRNWKTLIPQDPNPIDGDAS